MTAAKRLRPIHWDEVVGQEHVKDVLRPALERGRIGHAYLFSGPRGVGKTTTARLIAMTVNCETPGVKPCGTCDSCKSVIAGRHPDVLEIDAASNNSVDDVRDLREKVALQPMRGDKKIYILDEAHMMSKSAFNALLKTLEEPPSHAVFVLATTEPERLPATILSRCQHYRFRRLSASEIAGKLLKTATAEGVNASESALNLMARAADGAMRDGESLLERLLSAGEPNLTLEMVEGALGLPPQDRVDGLAFALARGETARVMQSLTAFYSDGFAPRTITERVKIALRDQLHSQLGLGKKSADSYGEIHLLRLIRALDEEDGRFARASDLIALEMAFTKAMLAPEQESGGMVSPALESRVSNLEKKVTEAFRKVVDEGLKISGQRPPSGNQVAEFDPTARTPRRAPAPPVPEDDAAPFEVAPAPPAAPVRETVVPSSGKGWADVILKADLRLRAILKEAKGYLSGDTLIIEYGSAKNKWHADQVAGKLEELATLVRQVIGEDVGLELIMPDGTKKNSRIAHNPVVNTAPQAAARVVQGVLETIKPQSDRVNPNATEQAQHVAPLQPSIQSPPEYPAPDQTPTDPTVGARRAAPAQSPNPPTQHVAPSPPPNPQARAASDLAFEALGTTHPKASLFSPAAIVAALEPEAFYPPHDDDDAPPLPTEYSSLETFDLENLADAAPLAALEIDFGDLDNLPSSKAPTSSLAGHPNYALLAKLFPHRVREVGQLEAKIAVADVVGVVAAVLTEPSDEAE